jgi:SAM-dependent methyltransferase
MKETSKSSALPYRQALYYRYLAGRGLDIGCGNDVLTLEGREIDGWDVQQGDAQYLSTVADESYDFVHSSHCLEHMVDVHTSLSNWARVVKPGGAIFITVPEWTFYERRLWPSIFNSDHKQIFTVMPFESPFAPNVWTVGRLMIAADFLGLRPREFFLELHGYDFALLSSRLVIDQTMPPMNAQAQVCFVFQKV